MTQHKTAVLVLGAPRSGTSSICHVISELGFYFGDPARFVDPVTHPWNPIFFELLSLNELNNEIARALGFNYFDFDWLVLEEDFGEEITFGFEESVDQFLQQEFGAHDRIALKDPRFCLTLPFWRSVLTRRGYEVRYVWAVRDLSACFVSNKIADDSRSPRYLQERLLTLSSYLAAYFLEGENYYFANYDQYVTQPEKNVSALANWLGVAASRVNAACSVIQPVLRHVLADETTIPLEIQSLSKLLLNDRLTANHYLEFRGIMFAYGFAGLLRDRMSTIADLRSIIATKDDYIAVVVSSKDKYIADLQRASIEKDQYIEHLSDKEASQRRALADQLLRAESQLELLKELLLEEGRLESLCVSTAKSSL
jgi:hypothetical protein